MRSLLEGLPNLITGAVEASPLVGYGAIALVMLLENVLPPIPSELVMPLAGFLVQQGQLELVPTVLAALLGTVLGAWFWYGIGRLINERRLEHWLARHGRWLGIGPHDLARSRRWFNRHGVAVVFWGRIIPGVRALVPLPAGIELMPQIPFLIWTTAGSLIWILLLTLAGQALGAGYVRVLSWVQPLAELAVALIVLAIAVGLVIIAARVVKARSKRRSPD